MILLDLDKAKLNDKNYLAENVKKVLEIKFSNNSVENCFDFYNGKKPFISIDDYEPKIFNFAKPITDTATKVFIGETPDIYTYGNKTEKDKITAFKKKLYKRSFQTNLFQVGKSSSICGSGFLAIYNAKGDTFPKFRYLNPIYADVVYDCSLSRERLFAFQIETITNIDNKSFYRVYVYTKTNVFVFETDTIVISKDIKITPITAFVNNGKPVETIVHGYKDIPVIEFPNNEDYKGDFECVFDLIVSYNELQNNRLKNVDDIVQYILLVRNASLGDSEETKEVLKTLKESRVLALDGENVDAKYLANPLNQDQMRVLSEEIKNAIHYISRVPDLSSVDFSQNASDPILKMKTKPLVDLCGEKELSFTPSLLLTLEIILDYCEKYDKKEFGTYNFDLNDVQLIYAHELPSNDTDMVTQIANLTNSGLINPEEALQHISWIENPHEYMKGAKKWKEYVDKSKEKENNNNGVNQTNIERQNAKPMSTDMYDNKNNGAIGVSNRMSENK